MAVKTWISTFLLIYFNLIVTNTRSIPDVKSRTGQERYLRRYGYADFSDNNIYPDGRPSMTDADFRSSLVRFQKFFNSKLEITGLPDAPTVALMERGRCGMADIDARFELHSTTWSQNIQWRLNWTHEDVSESDAKQVMRDSVKIWQEWMKKITVTETTDSSAELTINYVMTDATGEHGDGNPFGSGTLAHAFYPHTHWLGGDMHYNMKENFDVNDPPASTSYSLNHVTRHELGHSLGMAHTDIDGALMFPYVSKGITSAKLHNDDIQGIQAIYGACYLTPCQNSGTCTHIQVAPQYTCNCAEGWTGTNCELSTLPCTNDPCQNGGTCENSADGTSRTCTCPNTHTGTDCETELPCAANPCMNSGQCTNTGVSAYTCNCPNTHTGTNCETATACNSGPCLNQGTCHVATNSAGYSCSCTAQFTGNTCSVSVCASNPCAINGGTCALDNSPTGYTCSSLISGARTEQMSCPVFISSSIAIYLFKKA